MKDIPCGTAGGVVIYFDKIEVVNKLTIDHLHKTIKLYGPHYDKTWIFDKIHHEINQFCSSHSLSEVYITEFERLDEALAKALQRVCTEWDTGIEVSFICFKKELFFYFFSVNNCQILFFHFFIFLFLILIKYIYIYIIIFHFSATGYPM